MIAADPSTFNAEIETLTTRLESTTDAATRDAAKALVRLVLEFHRAGLATLVGAVEQQPNAAAVLNDPVVASLMALHELTPRRTPLIQITRRHDARSATGFDPSADVHRCRCDECGAALEGDHRHVVDLETRRVACSCRACWLLAGATEHRIAQRPVPEKSRSVASFAMTDVQWTALEIPVDIAFFMTNSTIGRTIAFYPGPAGATESALPLDAWHDVAAANPAIRSMRPDVEALLVRRYPSIGAYNAAVVPIDVCYGLVGRVRQTWSGITGGEAARCVFDEFFATVGCDVAGALEHTG